MKTILRIGQLSLLLFGISILSINFAFKSPTADFETSKLSINSTFKQSELLKRADTISSFKSKLTFKSKKSDELYIGQSLSSGNSYRLDVGITGKETMLVKVWKNKKCVLTETRPFKKGMKWKKKYDLIIGIDTNNKLHALVRNTQLGALNEIAEINCDLTDYPILNNKLETSFFSDNASDEYAFFNFKSWINQKVID